LLKGRSFQKQLALYLRLFRGQKSILQQVVGGKMTEELIRWFQDLGSWAVACSIILNMVVNLLGFIPSVFVTTVNVAVWGPIGGGLISWLGEWSGAVLAFWLYRYGFRKVTQGNKEWKWLQSFNRWSRKKQFLSLLLVRIAPMVPSGVVNLVGGMSRVSVFNFTLATALGKIPSISLEVLVSYDLLHFHQNWVRLILVLICLWIGILILKRSKQKENK
jgi:uncharacterized membrane protein YdjX (TVP38/TMEM64 family)